MELKNKRTMYDVTHADELISLSGSFTYTADARLSEFSGNFQETETTSFIGGFSFSEREGDLINKNINSIKKSLQTNCEDLLDDAIKLIKIEMTK